MDITAQFQDEKGRGSASSSSPSVIIGPPSDDNQREEVKDPNENPTDGNPGKKGCLGTAVFLLLILVWLTVI
ncbi:MAG: hypothetical protein P8P74_10870 [Crocinitomicaceae bacterium]|nr:hypothetical protein [Crocinitomicaceae bacterium]